MVDEGKDLKKLGARQTEYEYDKPSVHILETFQNCYPDREYNVQFIFPEFTSLCPKTGQPDFAKIVIDYVPLDRCIESKSLKLYLFAYRNCGSFMETITNKILDDLVAICDPRSMIVNGYFNARGGTFINVKASYCGKSS
jgi:7-cyano-7-deazaguanine reductase